jgi:hypothetical protein
MEFQEFRAIPEMEAIPGILYNSVSTQFQEFRTGITSRHHPHPQPHPQQILEKTHKDIKIKRKGGNEHMSLLTYICIYVFTRREKKKKRRERNRLKGHMILFVNTDHNKHYTIIPLILLAPGISTLNFIEKFGLV